MRNEEANGNKNLVDLIIAEFRATHLDPSPQDWLALIAAHPEAAGEIADAAMLHQTVEHLEESDVEAPLNREVFESGVSQAISRLYETPSASLRQAQERIAAVQGPSVRSLAREVGLGSAPALLSGILVGAVEVPRRVLDGLVVHLDLTAMVLIECFRRALAAAAVPAFKAEGGKPGLATEPTSWTDAVRSLHLPEEETRRLLQLQD